MLYEVVLIGLVTLVIILASKNAKIKSQLTNQQKVYQPINRPVNSHFQTSPVRKTLLHFTEGRHADKEPPVNRKLKFYEKVKCTQVDIIRVCINTLNIEAAHKRLFSYFNTYKVPKFNDAKEKICDSFNENTKLIKPIDEEINTKRRNIISESLNYVNSKLSAVQLKIQEGLSTKLKLCGNVKYSRNIKLFKKEHFILVKPQNSTLKQGIILTESAGKSSSKICSISNNIIYNSLSGLKKLKGNHESLIITPNRNVMIPPREAYRLSSSLNQANKSKLNILLSNFAKANKVLYPESVSPPKRKAMCKQLEIHHIGSQINSNSHPKQWNFSNQDRNSVIAVVQKQLALGKYTECFDIMIKFWKANAVLLDSENILLAELVNQWSISVMDEYDSLSLIMLSDKSNQAQQKISQLIGIYKQYQIEFTSLIDSTLPFAISGENKLLYLSLKAKINELYYNICNSNREESQKLMGIFYNQLLKDVSLISSSSLTKLDLAIQANKYLTPNLENYKLLMSIYDHASKSIQTSSDQCYCKSIIAEVQEVYKMLQAMQTSLDATESPEAPIDQLKAYIDQLIKQNQLIPVKATTVLYRSAILKPANQSESTPICITLTKEFLTVGLWSNGAYQQLNSMLAHPLIIYEEALKIIEFKEEIANKSKKYITYKDIFNLVGKKINEVGGSDNYTLCEGKENTIEVCINEDNTFNSLPMLLGLIINEIITTISKENSLIMNECVVVVEYDLNCINLIEEAFSQTHLAILAISKHSDALEKSIYAVSKIAKLISMVKLSKCSNPMYTLACLIKAKEGVFIKDEGTLINIDKYII